MKVLVCLGVLLAVVMSSVAIARVHAEESQIHGIKRDILERIERKIRLLEIEITDDEDDDDLPCRCVNGTQGPRGFNGTDGAAGRAGETVTYYYTYSPSNPTTSPTVFTDFNELYATLDEHRKGLIYIIFDGTYSNGVLFVPPKNDSEPYNMKDVIWQSGYHINGPVGVFPFGINVFIEDGVTLANLAQFMGIMTVTWCGTSEPAMNATIDPFVPNPAPVALTLGPGVTLTVNNSLSSPFIRIATDGLIIMEIDDQARLRNGGAPVFRIDGSGIMELAITASGSGNTLDPFTVEGSETGPSGTFLIILFRKVPNLPLDQSQYPNISFFQASDQSATAQGAAATFDPTPSNDAYHGYVPGAIWTNTASAPPNSFIQRSNDLDAAVWDRIPAISTLLYASMLAASGPYNSSDAIAFDQIPVAVDITCDQGTAPFTTFRTTEDGYYAVSFTAVPSRATVPTDTYVSLAVVLDGSINVGAFAVDIKSDLSTAGNRILINGVLYFQTVGNTTIELINNNQNDPITFETFTTPTFAPNLASMAIQRIR